MRKKYVSEDVKIRNHAILTVLGFVVFMVSCLSLATALSSAIEKIEPVSQVPLNTSNSESGTAYQSPGLDENQKSIGVKIGLCIVGVLLLIWFFSTNFGKVIGSILIVVVIVFGAGYAIVYSDKNGDGKGDSSIITMVQPDGNNVEKDAAYADINSINGDTNLKSTASFMGLFFMFLVGMCVISGLYILLKMN